MAVVTSINELKASAQVEMTEEETMASSATLAVSSI